MTEQRNINKSMTQVSRTKGETRKFEIYDDKFIDITIDNIFGQKNYQLNLCMLEPWPVRNRDISWRWLMSMIYFGIAAIAYGAYLVIHHDGEMLSRLIPFIVIFILLLLGSLLMFLYRSPNVTEFRSRYCGCVLISLLYANPNKEAFDQFVDELKQRILLSSQQVRVDKHRMLINEFTKLRRLRNDGIISEREYVAASRRIPNMRA
ncbi:MAG: hypothetical protein GC149_05000 [Gammaproteobacteria bacterium]|nr:hypothetical protein [Gammaproteobacteria bacterium]